MRFQTPFLLTALHSSCILYFESFIYFGLPHFPAAGPTTTLTSALTFLRFLTPISLRYSFRNGCQPLRTLRPPLRLSSSSSLSLVTACPFLTHCFASYIFLGRQFQLFPYRAFHRLISTDHTSAEESFRTFLCPFLAPPPFSHILHSISDRLIHWLPTKRV